MLEGYCSGRTKGKHTPCCNSVDILAWVDQYVCEGYLLDASHSCGEQQKCFRAAHIAIYEQHQYNRLRCDASYFELLLYTYMCCSEAILLFLWNKAMSEPLRDYSCGGGGCGWLPCLTDVGASSQSK